MALTQLPPVGPSAREEVPRRQPARESAARTYPRSLPVVPVRARGLTVEGADGRRYLDCLSGAGSLALGHNHPVVLEAIRSVLDSGAPLHVMDLATPVRDAFTEELSATLPRAWAESARIRFCGPVGTDAVRAALGLVRKATGRTGLLAFTGAHDRIAAAAPGGSVIRLPYPQDYRCPFGAGGADGARLAADRAESLLEHRGSRADGPAAMLVEPVLGEGGVIPAPDGWLRRMRELTAAHGIALIADETHTGVGRTGAFWAVEHSGVVPDVMVLSDAIGGSLPLTAIVHREELDAGRAGDRAGAFRGNQLAMAAGAATLKYVRENRLPERAAALGERMLAGLNAMAGECDHIGEVRGRGLMIGVEFVDPGAPGPAAGGSRPPLAAAPAAAAAVRRECLRRGLIVGLGGPYASVIRLLPPLTMTDEQADAVLDRFTDAVAAVSHGAHQWAPGPLERPGTPRRRGPSGNAGAPGSPGGWATPGAPPPRGTTSHPSPSNHPSTPKEAGAAFPA
ncbi:aminotransferase class III-fold pyridoxal phosphate-dependent enzyme [Streptomyces syringium]|uniref:aminotransferase class III-fold pyridoxal phosphate-dependent enzyme n=1 Tax=Streptomyces syringium TaxID=76729 RepID=UPI00343F7383